jgi:hypothetical protein
LKSNCNRKGDALSRLARAFEPHPLVRAMLEKRFDHPVKGKVFADASHEWR